MGRLQAVSSQFHYKFGDEFLYVSTSSTIMKFGTHVIEDSLYVVTLICCDLLVNIFLMCFFLEGGTR
jgi:hypothetical protein